MKRILTVWLCAMLLLATSCRQADPTPQPSADGERDPVRAMWIPYMEVEDLLSSGDPEGCRRAIADCMADCAQRGANTVYFHVRANSDAYYASSVYAPNPSTAALLEKGFDPLRCAVEEAAAVGLSLHAWVNPYRIGTDAARAVTDDVFEWDGRYYYVPTAADTSRAVTDGVKELVEHYAIGGVQFDDYFYPEGAVPADAPASFEASAYASYCARGGMLSVGDWRRAAVDSLVKAVYDICHTRENCVFGISPAYDLDANRAQKYADVAQWAKTDGYVDYLCPQLYFGYQHAAAPFEKVLSQWCGLERHTSVDLLIGLALYKTGLYEDTYAGVGKDEWATGGDIIARQIQDARAAGVDGAALYSHQSFSATGNRNADVVRAECQAACDAWIREF